MSLTDVMSGSGLTVYPLIGLTLFVFAFVLVLARVFGKGRAEADRRASMLPLEESASVKTGAGVTAERRVRR